MNYITHIVRIEITNNINDDVNIIWFIGNSEKKKNEFIDTHKEKIRIWNQDIPYAMSHRNISIDTYSPYEFFNLKFEDLKGLKIDDFLKVLKYEKEI